uniref:SAM-dependent MTase RsmB/NOP-type domain-containing protein n=1 Tax=Seriola dumerili TaxID=41447 RepID=A0A3B4VPC1_SERDU
REFELYQQGAYLQASAIFQQLREEKPVALQLLHYGKKTDTPLPESGDKTTQRRAYQLSADLLPLAMVMLFDLQDRRFLLRERSTKEGEEPLQEVRDLETSLHRCKTKLAASLARCRVKQNLQSVSCFLSDSVKTKQHRAKRLPLYAWVNTLKTSSTAVYNARGYSFVIKVLNFCVNNMCAPVHVCVFVSLQDRSVCVAVSVLRPLLFDNGDVLVVGSFSGVTVAHIAAVAAARSGRVLVCVKSRDTILFLKEKRKKKAILSEAFSSLNEWDATVQRLKVIIVLPQCSSSALNDPVPTIHSEHGDWDLLPDLSHGSVSQRKIYTMATQQARLLAHSLTFPKVQTVVYCTRSVYPEENEQLVKRVLEKTQTHPKLLPFRVNGPIFPDDSQSGDAADSKFFRLEPSQFTNGCFIARLSRQVREQTVETVQDVLARAAAKGLLGGIIPEQSKTGKRGKGRKNRVASATSKPSSPSGQETQTERGKGDFKGSEEEEEYKKEEDEGGEEEKKGRGLKGRKRKLKLRPKQIMSLLLLPCPHRFCMWRDPKLDRRFSKRSDVQHLPATIKNFTRNDHTSKLVGYVIIRS